MDTGKKQVREQSRETDQRNRSEKQVRETGKRTGRETCQRNRAGIQVAESQRHSPGPKNAILMIKLRLSRKLFNRMQLKSDWSQKQSEAEP